MKKEIQIVMLPTKDITNISKGNKENELIYSKEGFVPHIISTQHLYLVLDTNIKAGDWILSGKELFKSKTNENEGLFKKVIATTKKSLFIEGYCEECDNEGEITGPMGVMFECTKCPVINLPQPPQDFIEEYCRKGGIDKAMVEYKDFGVVIPSSVDSRGDYEGNCPKCHKYYNWMGTGGMTCSHTALKINSNNEITISPVKEKMYSDIDLMGNQEGSFDHFLLHSPKFSQEEREVIMDAVHDWLTKTL